ncbi:MAG: NADH-quinone oxidoreductase subunit D, partial [Chloroflexota bacterium]|nr:NADH-quinone oxidoreductase subunit D [Chloroflexota bacterium]
MPASTLSTLLEGRGDAGVGKARAMAPEELVALIERGALRGRGGAGFSLGKKMAAVRESAAR